MYDKRIGVSLLESKTYKKRKTFIRVKGTTISFAGNIDSMDTIKELGPLFSGLHEEIIEKNIKRIQIDITRLDFVNSSGISLFIKWTNEDVCLPDKQQYTIEFICSKENSWHFNSFETLTKINKDLFIITKQESE
jgi:hypothetical protein